MAGKAKLVLIDLRKYELHTAQGEDFLVKSVFNITSFTAGTFVNKVKVDELLSLGAYDITIHAATNADFKNYSL